MSRPTRFVPPSIARIERTRRVAIAAPAGRVFELASPLGEYDWIDGWSCDLVYPPSGAMEAGCIFREPMSGPFLLGHPRPTTWVVVRHDATALEVAFHLHLGESALGELVVQGERLGDDRSAFTFRLVLTALSPGANRLVAERAAPRVEAMIGFLSAALEHHCETGGILSREALLREHGLRHGPWLLGVLRHLGLG